MRLSDIRSSGKPRVLIFRQTVTETTDLLVPAGYYDIIAIGTGGTGGRAFSTSFARSTGGGGPAWARDWGRFDQPTTISFEAGSVAVGASLGSTAVIDGNSGGTSRVLGIQSPIVLTGGGGGKASGGSNVALDGGLGGVATGGKVRANGGRGGKIDATTVTGNLVTGGGAVDLFLRGTTRGGDISLGAGVLKTSFATGGAGVGGRGGDLVGTPTSTSTAGGGSGGPARDNTNASSVGAPGPDASGAAPASAVGSVPSDGSVLELLLTFPTLLPIGSGSGDYNSSPPRGGGGAPNYSANALPPAIPLGGGGGAYQLSGQYYRSSSVTLGGGSGGVSTVINNASQSYPGNGGAAFFIVSVYAEMS